MTATDTKPAPSRILQRPDAASPILVCAGPTGLAVRAGTVGELYGRTYTFDADTPVAFGEMKPGADYVITGGPTGEPVALIADTFNPVADGWFAGFHYAPGGNAAARAGGDSIPAINPYSLWDISFRPSCADPRGMALVEIDGGKRFWADIYLLGVTHAGTGASRFGAVIADGRSLAKLDYPTAVEIYAGHGKRLMTYDEFRAAAFGVTEKSSGDRDPKITGLDAARTSRFGLMQATGNMWIWGTDGDPDNPRPSIFGGSWRSGGDAGSRDAVLVDWAGLSNGLLSARGACDHMQPV